MLIYLIPAGLLAVAFCVSAIQTYADYRRNKREEEDEKVHYVESIYKDKYITTCNRKIDLDNKNVTNYIHQTTCAECLKKIT